MGVGFVLADNPPRFAEMINGKNISTLRPDPVEAAAEVGRR